MVDFLLSGDRAVFDRVIGDALAQDGALAATWRRRAKAYGIDSPFDLLTEVSRYDVTSVVGRITTPLLITDPDGEPFWPGTSRELYDALTGPKHLVRFTEAEGAHLHCEPMGRALFEQRVFDRLDDRLAAADGAGSPNGSGRVTH
ncbi:hypothetical protein [Streptomyces sp. Ag109_G2-15]|uniref:hypothetical protein n=1 Tax=Streptomyces sp. Ag109_G2-15 TaxID=1938850 RepID=UPI000C6F0B00|nr:hypothetical protein [Streptomyces sp. Ag109_G2-15]